MNIINALIWFQEDRITETGNEANVRESTLFSHACFLIKSMSQREEHIRDISVSLLTQLRDKFPQVCCSVMLFALDCLFFLFSCDPQLPSSYMEEMELHICRFCGIHLV